MSKANPSAATAQMSHWSGVRRDMSPQKARQMAQAKAEGVAGQRWSWVARSIRDRHHAYVANRLSSPADVSLHLAPVGPGTDHGELSGRVTDASGGVLPGVDRHRPAAGHRVRAHDHLRRGGTLRPCHRCRRRLRGPCGALRLSTARPQRGPLSVGRERSPSICSRSWRRRSKSSSRRASRHR